MPSALEISLRYAREKEKLSSFAICFPGFLVFCLSFGSSRPSPPLQVATSDSVFFLFSSSHTTSIIATHPHSGSFSCRDSGTRSYPSCYLNYSCISPIALSFISPYQASSIFCISLANRIFLLSLYIIQSTYPIHPYSVPLHIRLCFTTLSFYSSSPQRRSFLSTIWCISPLCSLSGSILC